MPSSAAASWHDTTPCHTHTFVPIKVQGESDLPRQRLLRTYVESAGDKDFPMSAKTLREVVYKALGLPPDTRLPGLTQYDQQLRQMCLDRTFVEDGEDIDPEEVFDYHVPCAVLHPGLCERADEREMPLIERLATHARQYLAKFKKGTYHKFTFQSRGGYELTKFAFMAYQRGARPQIVILVKADFDPATQRHRAKVSEGQLFEFEVDLTFFGLPVKDDVSWDDETACLKVQHLPLGLHNIEIGDDGCIEFNGNIDPDPEVELHPNPPKLVRNKSKKTQIEKGLDALKEPKPSRIVDNSLFRKRPRVAYRRNRPDYSQSSESDSDSAATGESKDVAILEEGDLPLDEPPPIPDADPDPPHPPGEEPDPPPPAPSGE